MRKKPIKTSDKENKKRERIIYTFLIITVITVIIGAFFVACKLFVADLYIAFVLDFLASSFLYAAGLLMCSFFLYLFFTITLFNPQRIKKSSVIKFAFSGVITLGLTILLLDFSVTETIKGVKDMNAYSNGEWKMKDLEVLDIYRGGYHNVGGPLIETKEGEMSLQWESFRINKGETYRFTYLDATKTIIKVEMVTD
jgi:hypothetical protein